MSRLHLKFTSIIFTLAAALFLLQSAAAQVRNQAPVGTRPQSMGEAFAAVADDGNAIYWNPAGLARMERIQAGFAYADLFGLGINSFYASFLSRVYFIPPLTDYLAFGVDWFRIHTLDADPSTGADELEFAQDQINFSLAFRPPKSVSWLRNLSLGANLKYLKIGGSLDGHPQGNVYGWGWDGGLLYDLGALPRVLNGLQFGLMVYNGGGGLWAKNDATENSSKILHQNLRYALSYRPFSDWPGGKIPISDPILALDFDDRVHVGLEFWLAKTLALRAGWQKDWRTNERPTLAFGVGFKNATKDFPELHIDYALTDSPVLPNTNKQFGGALIIKDNPRVIRIAGAQIQNVFPSLYQHYALPGYGIGSVKLKNTLEDTLIAWVTFQSRYMQPQSADTVKIPAKSTMDFPLRAGFTSDLLYARESRLAGEVKVTYEYRKNQYTTTGAVDFALCGKNYLTWDDPGKAAAFVTTDELLAQRFVDQALAKAPEFEQAAWVSRLNMSKAMIIFNALQAYGMKYRLDEITPYPSLADTSHGALYRLDTIQYPGELLLKDDRAGDCDDLSALYATMLQYAGLPTAFVTGPGHGHIFIMFDTNIPASQSRSLPVSPNLFVKRRGTLWLPIETTMIPNSTFGEAWMHAAGVIDSTWQIYEVAAYQSKYPPVKAEVIDLPRAPLTIPDFAPALQKDFVALNGMKTQWLQKIQNALEREVQGLPALEAAKARNIYGVLLGQNDEHEQAREQFNKILQDSAAFAPAWNNLGNVEFVTGNFSEAEKAYKRALTHNRFSRGTYLNLAILYQMMKSGAAPRDTVEYQRQSEGALLQAAQILEGDAQNAFNLLQFPEEGAAGKAESFVEKVKRQINKVKNYVDKSFKKYLQKQEVKGIVLDRHGAKGRGEIDQDRTALLAWIY
jgi:tetratricopeptide (TPR) repeat protein